MENQRSTPAVDGKPHSNTSAWEPFERRVAPAFTIAGLSLIASLLLPVGLAAFAERAWIAGLLLVGFGVVAVTVGLVGLYPRIDARSPRLATIGVLSGVVAGVSALGLIALGTIALVGPVVSDVTLGTPMGAFSAIAISMASGYSVGFLSYGVHAWRATPPSRTAGLFLLLGGGLLLVPVVGELVRFAAGTGPPPWLFVPAVGGVSLATLALGLTLRSEG